MVHLDARASVELEWLPELEQHDLLALKRHNPLNRP